MGKPVETNSSIVFGATTTPVLPDNVDAEVKFGASGVKQTVESELGPTGKGEKLQVEPTSTGKTLAQDVAANTAATNSTEVVLGTTGYGKPVNKDY